MEREEDKEREDTATYIFTQQIEYMKSVQGDNRERAGVQCAYPYTTNTCYITPLYTCMLASASSGAN